LPPELLLFAQICTESFVGWGYTQTPLDSLADLGGEDPLGNGKEGGEGKGKERRNGETESSECPNP